MILISLLIQINSTDNEMSIKKFVYLMINAIERQNNIKKSIEFKKLRPWIARESTAYSIYIIQYTSFNSIKRIKEIKIFDCLRIIKNSLSNQQFSFQKTKDFDYNLTTLLLSIVLRSID
jgi:hypothetical protein